MSYRFKEPAILLASLLLTFQAQAATLIGPASVVAPGEASLLSVDLGFPGTFWFIPVIEWEEPEAVQIQVGVFTPDGDDGTPVTHTLLMNTGNQTPDQWDGFDISIAGPASVTDPLLSPATVSQPPFLPSDVTDTTISFDGLDWNSGDFLTFGFGIDVTPPVSDEPVVITLSPSAVPEPSGVAILMIGGLMVLNRRRKRV